MHYDKIRLVEKPKIDSIITFTSKSPPKAFLFLIIKKKKSFFGFYVFEKDQRSQTESLLLNAVILLPYFYCHLVESIAGIHSQFLQSWTAKNKIPKPPKYVELEDVWISPKLSNKKH